MFKSSLSKLLCTCAVLLACSMAALPALAQSGALPEPNIYFDVTVLNADTGARVDRGNLSALPCPGTKWIDDAGKTYTIVDVAVAGSVWNGVSTKVMSKATVYVTAGSTASTDPGRCSSVAGVILCDETSISGTSLKRGAAAHDSTAVTSELGERSDSA